MAPKRSARTPARGLSDLELEVMQVLWKAHEATADEVRRALRGQRLTDSSVRTILRRLEAKGAVAHRREGRRFLFCASMRRGTAAAAAVRRVLERVCGGAVDALLVGMVEGGVIGKRDLERVHAALAAIEQGTD